MAVDEKLQIAVGLFIVILVLVWIWENRQMPYHTGCGMSNPVYRAGLSVKESFANMPAGPALHIDGKDISDPYILLEDILPAAAPGGRAAAPTAERCFDGDFQTRIELTRNYRQMTNNYKRGVPDSCSGWNHELVNSFYKVDELPAA
jgi:hypothetical protein